MIDMTSSGAVEQIDKLNAEAWSLRDEDVSRARAKNNEVFKLLEANSTYHKGMVEALTTKAFLQMRSSEFKESLEYSLKAEKLCHEFHLIELLAKTYNVIGICYATLSVFGLASQYFYKQLYISQELNDTRQIASATHDLGFFQMVNGDTDIAIAMFEEAKVLFEQQDAEWSVTLAKRNIVECYLAKGLIDKAEILIEECLRFVEENSHDVAESLIYSSLAKVYEHNGEYEKALYCITRVENSEKSFLKENSPLIFKARMVLHLKRFQEAETILKDCIVDEKVNSKTRLYCFKLLADCYAQQGLLEESHQTLLEYVACNDLYYQDIRRKSVETSVQVEDLERLRIEAQEAKHSNLALQETVKELHTLQQKYYQQSIIDPLTGIPNRRYITEFLTTNFAAAKRYKYSLGLAIIDLDNFKSINDNFSHQVGDDVLKQVAQFLQSHCRESDAIARFGGEEFILAFKETSIEDNIAFCERLRKSIESYDWQQIADGLKVTASFGLASLANLPTCNRFEDLISFADKKLYESKDKGRNCVSY